MKPGIAMGIIIALYGLSVFAESPAKSAIGGNVEEWEMVFLHPTDNECRQGNGSWPPGNDRRMAEEWLNEEGFHFQPLQPPQNTGSCIRSLYFNGTPIQARYAFGGDTPIVPEQLKNIIEHIHAVPMAVKKPVIYLYPERQTQVKVQLEYQGTLTATYPIYHNGWKVTAHPDGRLVNMEDGKEYTYLFWEGSSSIHDLKIEDGFVVKASDSVHFLQEKLQLLGLTPKEYNEFIVFWLPELLKSPYNLIHFSGEDYRRKARLHIMPSPDSEIRVFMLFRRLPAPVGISEQVLIPVRRKGFAVIEWGGAEVP